MKSAARFAFQRFTAVVLAAALILTSSEAQHVFSAIDVSSGEAGRVVPNLAPGFRPSLDSLQHPTSLNSEFLRWRLESLEPLLTQVDRLYEATSIYALDQTGDREATRRFLENYDSVADSIVQELDRVRNEYPISERERQRVVEVIESLTERRSDLRNRVVETFSAEEAEKLLSNAHKTIAMSVAADPVAAAPETFGAISEEMTPALPQPVSWREKRVLNALRKAAQSRKTIGLVTANPTATKGEVKTLGRIEEIQESGGEVRVVFTSGGEIATARDLSLSDIRRVEIGNWDKVALMLTRWPTWAIFAVLSLPQIFTNSANLVPKYPFLQAVLDVANPVSDFIHSLIPFIPALELVAGDPSRLSGQPYVGMLSTVLANSMLITYFSTNKEYAPAVVQTIGIVMTLVTVAQVFMAGFMPLWVLALAMLIFPMHLWINWERALASPRDRFFFGQIPGNLWDRGMALLGFLMVLPGGLLTFGVPALNAASLVGGIIFASWALRRMIAERRGLLSDEEIEQWHKLGGWVATAFFLIWPVTVLISTTIDPNGLLGLNPNTFFMGILGNLFMLGRAVVTKDLIWFVGSAGGTLLVLAVMIRMFTYGVTVGVVIVPAWFMALTAALTLVAFPIFWVVMNQRFFGDSPWKFWQSFDFLWPFKKGAASALNEKGDNMPIMLDRKNKGLPYDVEDPEVYGVHGVRDVYGMTLRFNAADPGDPARGRLLRELLPNAGADIQVDAPFMLADGINIQAGRGVRIYSHVDIGDNSPVTLGNNVVIGAGSTLTSLEHPMLPDERVGNYVKSLPIAVGDGTIIGARSTIMPGVKIGKNVWVMNDSVVTKHVPDGVLIQGKPARKVRDLTPEEMAGGLEGFRKLSPGIEDFGKIPDARRQLPATVAALKQFNLVPLEGGLFGGAIPYLAQHVVPSMRVGVNNNVFPPFWCEDGKNIKFTGSSGFINNGGMFYDADPAKPITIGGGVYFGPKVTVHGGAKFGNGSWIGGNAIIGEGAVIGDGTIVAAGTNIPPHSSVPPFTVVLGIPEAPHWRVLRHLNPELDSWSLDAETMQKIHARLAERGVNLPQIEVPAGPSPVADPDARVLNVSTMRVNIKELGNVDRRISIYTPPNYHSSGLRYPVLYMHDGQNLFSDDASAMGRWQVNRTLDELIKNDIIPGLIVVGIDSSMIQRWDEYSPWKNSDNIRGGMGDAYARFIVETLKPMIDLGYRTLPDRDNTGIAGSSMGGLISLYIALKYSHLFSKVGVFSPAFWFARNEMREFIWKTRLSHPMNVYMDVGTEEGDRKAEYLDDANAFNELLGQNRHIDQQFVVYQGGRHHESAWAKRFPNALQWLYREIQTNLR